MKTSKVNQVVSILLSMNTKELKEAQVWLREFIKTDEMVLVAARQLSKKGAK